MAEKGKKQYNLRSVSNSVQLPVQIHMNSDSCSAVVESSGDEQNPPTKNTHSTSSTSSTLPGVSALFDVATQQAINLQILSQLSSISDRLNTLEKKGAKKDSDLKKKKSSIKKKASLKWPWSHCHLNSMRLSTCQI